MLVYFPNLWNLNLELAGEVNTYSTTMGLSPRTMRCACRGCNAENESARIVGTSHCPKVREYQLEVVVRQF